MTLVWCDGFDGYGNTDGSAPSPTGVVADKYASTQNESLFDNENTARTGGWALRLNSTFAASSGYFVTGDVVSGDTCIAGLAHYVYAVSNLNTSRRWPLLAFRNIDGNVNVELIAATGHYWVAGPNRSFLGSCRCPSVIQKYQYVEMKVYSHATAGTIEIRVNGCPVFVKTGLNTLYASAKPTVAVSVGGNYPAKNDWFAIVDDFYVCDGTGSDNNDFLGPIAVETLWASSDVTTNFAITGNANYSTHYEQTFREDRDETTDYVEDSAPGNTDVYGMDTAPTYDSVKGVVIWGAVAYASSTSNYRFSLGIGAATTYSSNTVCPSSTEIHSFVVENDPSTNSAFTSAALDSVLCGIEVVS